MLGVENAVLCVRVCFQMGMIACFYADENLAEESVNRKLCRREERLVGTCPQPGAEYGLLWPGWGAWEGGQRAWLDSCKWGGSLDVSLLFLSEIGSWTPA